MEDKEVKSYLKKIAEANKPQAVVKRAIITGVFSALGATIGFAIVIILSAAILSTIKTLPILDEIIKQTKIDVLIQQQLDNLSENQDDQVFTTTEIESLNIKVDLPLSLKTSSITKTTGGEIIEFLGTSSIRSLKFYENPSKLEIAGDDESFVAANTNFEIKSVRLYQNGATIDNVSIELPVVYIEFKNQDANFGVLALLKQNSVAEGIKLITNIVAGIKPI